VSAARPARARTSAAHPAPASSGWTPAEALALLAIALAAFLGKDALLAQRWVLALKPSLHVLVRVAALAAYYLVQLAALVAFAGVRERDLLAAVRLRISDATWRERVASAALTAGLTIATLVAALVYAVVLQEIGMMPDSAGMADIFGPDATGFFLSVAMIAIVAPLAEEVVFRGVLLDVLAARWGMWPGILGTAVVFSAFHVSWWTLAPTLILGVSAGWLALRRRSLWPAVALHAAYNLTLVAVTYLLAA
jgi:membrane protease YdiL (CAAX protease family)